MRRPLSIFLILFFTIFASKGVSIPYSASIMNADGSTAAGELISLNFAFTGKDGNVLFSETHSDVRVNSIGIVEVNVGSGETVAGSFDSIDWSDDNISATVVITRTDGGTVSDTLPLISVPHSLGAIDTSSLTAVHGDTKYTLSVSDDGNLFTTKRSVEAIPIPDGYTKMIFHDEFDVDGMLNPEFWGYEEGYVRGGEMQYYTVARPENAYVKDGLLHIVTLNDNWTDENGTTHAVTSASVTTKDKVKFTYGRVDIRAKLPICLGSWPALWMMPNDEVYGYWPNSGEIDIIEHVGFNPYNIYFTAHCAEQNGNDNKYHGSTSLPTCTTEFHIYSLEWSENRLDWYIDGKRKWTVVKNSNTWRGWPYNKDFYMIMNTAFGGSWGGQKGVDLEALPITFEIDYIRIFQ